jgi:hypothetical protein
MLDLLVFEVLNEIRGEEAFPHTAFAVQDDDELFFHGLGFDGLNILWIGNAWTS